MRNSFHPHADAKVVVVGDLILDRYLHGATTRISPEAPVPVLQVAKTEERPGGAANVALNIRRLGVPVQLAGIAGVDASAIALRRLLTDGQVSCHFLEYERFPTITKVRIISQHQQLLRLDYEQDIPDFDADRLLRLFRGLVEGADCVVLSDYAKGSLASVSELISYARSLGVRVLVDPKASDFERYRGATLLTPNQREFEAIVGTCSGHEEIVRRALDLCRHLGLDALLVTQGEHGMTLVDMDTGTGTQFGTKAHEVFDVTGAGDTVIAALAAAVVSGYSLVEGVEIANLCAGLVVEKVGTATVGLDELNEFLSPGSRQERKIVDKSRLMEVVTAARLEGKRIVLTNGCFDLLHAGHVSYLEKARRLGDLLIVAVNSDQSVSTLKGPKRPVTTLMDRMCVLAGLAAVDWVTDFDEDTPEQLIKEICPNVLVKGGDYRVDQIAGAKHVIATGGEVIIVPYITGNSTSALVDVISGDRS